jgi:hypothetical protein
MRRRFRWALGAASACCLLSTGCGRAPGAAGSTERPEATSARLMTAGQPLPATRSRHASVLLANGDVLVVGGIDATTADVASCFLYAASTGTWSQVGALHYPRSNHAAVRLASGDVLAFGGGDATTELRDHVAGGWTSVAMMAKARRGFGWFQRSDGSIVVAGGNSPDAVLGSTEIFDVGTRAWTSGPTLVHPRAGIRAIPLDDDRFAVLGGYAIVGVETDGGLIGQYTDEIEVCTISTNACALSSLKLSAWRARYTATRTLDGRYLIAGGYGSGSTQGALESTEIFDPKAMTLTPGPNLLTAREEHAATLLPSGQVLIMGGEFTSALPVDAGPGVDAGTYDPSAPLEIVDVVANLARVGPTPAHRRFSLTATTLLDGRALLVGGGDTSAFASRPPETADVDLFVQGTDGASCATPGDCVSGVCSASKCVGGSLPDAGADGAADAGAPDTGAVDTGPADASTIDTSTIDARVLDAAPPSPDATPPVSGRAQVCTKDAECASGHCVDHVCCDSTCVGTCVSCALPASPGICAFVPFGLDPRGSCGAASACVATCSGAGACIGATGSSVCAPSTCIDATRGEGLALCSGAGGACSSEARVAFDCAPYACVGAFGACASQCASTSDCAPGLDCDVTSGHCLPPANGGSGGGCVAGGGGPERGVAAGAVLALALALVARGRRRGRA